LIGCCRGWQNRAEILIRFGTRKREAASRYRQFVAAGIAMGRRDELTGGWLRRSAGGREWLMKLKRAKEYWRGDPGYPARRKVCREKQA